MADVISLDFGTKRIGVARANTESKIPEPLDHVLVDGQEFNAINKLVKSLSVDVVVVGLPRNSSGQETAESKRIKDVVTKLKKSDFSADIVFQDESTTSLEADKIMSDSSLPYANISRDSMAASIILSEYLEKL